MLVHCVQNSHRSLVYWKFLLYCYLSHCEVTLLLFRTLLEFTMWGVIISLFCSLFLLFQNLVVHCHPHSQMWKLSQFIFSVSMIYQIFIFCVYWMGIFPYSTIHLWGSSSPRDYSLYVTQHVVPALLITIDFLVNPIVIWNFIHLPFYISLLAVYLAVNCAYTLQVADVYMMVNYRNGLTYAFLAACVGAILVCHFVIRLYCRCCKEERIVWLLNEMRKYNINNMIMGPNYLGS